MACFSEADGMKEERFVEAPSRRSTLGPETRRTERRQLRSWHAPSCGHGRRKRRIVSIARWRRIGLIAAVRVLGSRRLHRLLAVGVIVSMALARMGTRDGTRRRVARRQRHRQGTVL